ncbi:hypothetical protein BDD43_5319 [Mucilaginibacter gracilis]|uniref:Uncharacterized protein n=1 Tax=Mucilaginibacter gracilis TaxID=423350 RepID=A0A495J8G8_9SPHI|nr:hypothetical protein [Mucilaginibacter gracilis]RKR85063.1 hypothetical protein BDD43_5319 [Mucilaginibacter gracilis]
MNIRIMLSKESGFMDLIDELGHNEFQKEINRTGTGKKYTTYILPKEWYDTLTEFSKIRIEAFRS